MEWTHRILWWAWFFLGLATGGFIGMWIRSLKPEGDSWYEACLITFVGGLIGAVSCGILGNVLRYFGV